MGTGLSSEEKGRTRNYATMVYPESAPVDWRETLVSFFVPAFISPLHNNDFNPTGEKKKDHFHVVIMFDGPKTPEQAVKIFDAIGGVGCEVVHSIRGYTRYLCHLDNPEKAQYSQDDVVSLCGADYASVIGLSTDKYKALCEMEEFCEKYDVVSFFALARYASAYRTDWSRVLKDNGSFYMREYLQSRKWSKENNCTHIVDQETGEVII